MGNIVSRKLLQGNAATPISSAARKRTTRRMKIPQDEPALLDSIDRRILAELQDDGRMT